MDLLADCRAVMDRLPVKAMHTGELRDTLAARAPGVRGHLDAEALSSMLRAARVKLGTVWSAAGIQENVSASGVVHYTTSDETATTITLRGRVLSDSQRYTQVSVQKDDQSVFHFR
ncbi:hypothetical protein ACQP04_09660 [Pseudonocardia halophobica]|uniref:hypothetical protein n=1 Tax=Pseudonocardia halophobica TaxID=29401 RepID=UPI003D95022B